MNELRDRAIAAASSFLERNGYRVIETDPRSTDNGIVALDSDDTLVFIEMSAMNGAEAGMPSPSDAKRARARKEAAAGKWLSEQSGRRFCGKRVRFDVIGMMVLPGGTALIRHHIDCLA